VGLYHYVRIVSAFFVARFVADVWSEFTLILKNMFLVADYQKNSSHRAEKDASLHVNVKNIYATGTEQLAIFE
jgi:hypothetical protein